MSHSTSQTVVNGQAFGYVPNGIHNLLMFGDANKNIFLAQPCFTVGPPFCAG
jgi:nitrite reductase (NO-forming)